MKTARSKGTPCLMTLFKVPGGTHPKVGLLYDPVLGAQQFNGKHEGCDDHTVTLTYPHTDQCILTVKESSQLLAVRIQMCGWGSVQFFLFSQQAELKKNEVMYASFNSSM